MPAWSYGHRLYKAAWFEDSPEGLAQLELGPYRHSTGHLYRRFKHSWPLFRRHISLTARQMVNALGDEDQLDAQEKMALNQIERPLYLSRHFWPKSDADTLYYASIDLQRFYPNVKKSAILNGLRLHLPEYADDEWLQEVLNRLLDFRIGRKGSRLLGDPVVQPKTTAGKLDGIPTGLMVAGFLSNVALLPLDKLIEQQLQESRRIAHFRFVDDHAILAYDFDDLRNWIREYENLLVQLNVGPSISPTKFDPPEMADAYHSNADAAAVRAAKGSSALNGSYPAKLMTRTLALVSELAGIDFDILTEDSRNQRLNELEWLLLADMPDREIRSDTRAAFAAGRITTLVPIAFGPSNELLRAWRNVARLEQKLSKAATEDQRSELELAKGVVTHFRNDEVSSYRRRIHHYFKLVFQAFTDHPDKPRLFIRVLDYCRAVGHNGTDEVLEWILTRETTSDCLLADYLKPLAMQTIARHVVTAAFDFTNPKLLNRRRSAARRYLRSIVRPKLSDAIIQLFNEGRREDIASVASRDCFLAAISFSLSCAAKDGRETPLHNGLVRLAEALSAPALAGSSTSWVKTVNAPIGVWTHWLDSLLRQDVVEPGVAWKATSPSLDLAEKLDWLNLRKGPQYLTKEQAVELTKAKLRHFVSSDAGWLLDQQASANPIDLSRVRQPVASRLKLHLAAATKQRERITAQAWVQWLRKEGLLRSHDPRASEWTALEILGQLLDRIKAFPDGIDLAALDDLHPTNILLPASWLSNPPDEQRAYDRWTWESWRGTARSNLPNIMLLHPSIEDYRRSPTHAVNVNDPRDLWISRLRGCGLLLLGLIRKDFRLPSSWNVRGLERDTASFVRSTLQEIPVSSHTHAIVEATLLPRNVETAAIRVNPWAFFGSKPVMTINDTKTDPPLLPDLESLRSAVVDAQNTLEAGQISVLDHTPRQLIPMNVTQLRRAAEKVEE